MGREQSHKPPIKNDKNYKNYKNDKNDNNDKYDDDDELLKSNIPFNDYQKEERKMTMIMILSTIS